MKGIVQEVLNDNTILIIELEEPYNLKTNDIVNVQKKRKMLNSKQQGLYFAYLQFCLENKEIKQTYYSITALHETCKAFMSETFNQDFQKGFSLTDLSNSEFNIYFTNLDFSFFVEGHGVDTSGFHADYQKFQEWKEFNPDGDYKTYREVTK